MARLIHIGMLLMLLALAPGCGGCRHNPEAEKTPEEIEKEREERKKKEAEAAKPDFESKFLVSRPRISHTTDESVGGLFVKPGHWTFVALEDAKTNHFDFIGELELLATDNTGNPIPHWRTPFSVSICRDMALPKKQPKSLESLLFVPPGSKSPSATYYFNAGRGGRHVVESPRQHLMGFMPSWQYHFVVLARTPESYAYLARFPAIRRQNGLDDTGAPSYRLAMLKADRHAPLPDAANHWTSIACVLWDDAASNALDLVQQQAMLDWLHWGGQLIISGPDSLDALRGGFLAPYLPAQSGAARAIDKQQIDALNAFSAKVPRRLAPARTWSGVRLQKQPQAEFVPRSGELFVERRVGRGRIVVSAFRLSEREFADWPGCDDVYNAMLLRHPPRRHVTHPDTGEQVQWADDAPQRDAARVTDLRYFARDAGVPFGEYCSDAVTPPRQEANAPYSPRSYSRPANYNPDSEDSPPAPGVAAWNDFNPVAKTARETLQSAARIEIPNRSFVLWVVAMYVIVLVPLNWFIFRGLRRVEWAWVAAPVIAVVCTGTVIRLAQLDIGFARSRTEIAVVELQGDYPRAHVARYNALYTSLATSYDLSSNDLGAAILPFPTVNDPNAFRMSYGQQVRKLTCRRGDDVALSGFFVGSNSTGLVHSEQMLDVGGGISLVKNNDGKCSLINRSSLTLHGVGLLRKNSADELEEAWIGEVPAAEKGAAAPAALPVHWNPLDRDNLSKPLWTVQQEKSAVSASVAPQGTLSLRGLLTLAQGGENLDTGKAHLVGRGADVNEVVGGRPAPQPTRRPVGSDLDVGEVRLIGWSDNELPGLAVKPSAPQTKRGALVVAHLGYALGPAPQPDVNYHPEEDRRNDENPGND